jgi:hypothetical protein
MCFILSRFFFSEFVITIINYVARAIDVRMCYRRLATNNKIIRRMRI